MVQLRVTPASNVTPQTQGFSLVPTRVNAVGAPSAFSCAEAPAWAGVDPYNKRIDRNSGDNGVAVTLD